MFESNTGRKVELSPAAAFIRNSLPGKSLMRLDVSKKQTGKSPKTRIADFCWLLNCGRFSGVLLLFSLGTASVVNSFVQPSSSQTNLGNTELILTSITPTFPKNSSLLAVETKFELSERDVADTVSYFRTEDASRAVLRFQSRMPNSITDEKFRQTVFDNLPPVIKKLQIQNTKIIEQFTNVILPVWSLYTRENIYNVVIVQARKPFIFIESGVVLVVSTGLIAKTESDDELLGLVAHEIAHEYFTEYSFYTKQILKAIEEGNQESVLERKYLEALSLIELHCDAFAALSLASMNYQPVSFIEFIERIDAEITKEKINFHPTPQVRKAVVQRILPKKISNIKTRVSKDLINLQSLMKNSIME